MSEGCQPDDLNRTRGLSWGLSCQAMHNSFSIHQNGAAVQGGGGVDGGTYPTPPFLFDLAHLSCAVPGSLLELPPRWLCPLDGEGGGRGDGGDGRDGRGALRGGVRGGWDDRLGRPTPEHFHKSRVSKQASVCGNRGILKSARHLSVVSGELQAALG